MECVVVVVVVGNRKWGSECDTKVEVWVWVLVEGLGATESEGRLPHLSAFLHNNEDPLLPFRFLLCPEEEELSFTVRLAVLYSTRKWVRLSRVWKKAGRSI